MNVAMNYLFSMSLEYYHHRMNQSRNESYETTIIEIHSDKFILPFDEYIDMIVVGNNGENIVVYEIYIDL
jgi:hypothetical protein